MHLRAPDPQPPFLEMTLFTLPPVLGEALNADPHPPFIWNLLPASSVFFGRIPQTLAFCGEHTSYQLNSVPIHSHGTSRLSLLC